MNVDIVTRLRDTQFGGRSLCREAADEIERLRAELEAKPRWSGILRAYSSRTARDAAGQTYPR